MPLSIVKQASFAAFLTSEKNKQNNFNVEGITTACEYLADQGLIGKASTAVRLTKKSNVDMQELAFFDLGSRAEN